MPHSVKVPPDPKAKRYPFTLEEIFAAASARSRVPPHPPEQARVTLLALLDRWEAVSAIPGMQAERTELAEGILDVFSTYPEATTWHRAWRALHPEAKPA